jgi:phosphatidylserine/phosphatidylglycerophosphate/cardiolipin synthase-like enzyme
VQTIDGARSTVLVQAYSFTSQPIAEAIVRAHERGIKVHVLLDKSQRTQKYTAAHILVQAGISVLIDAAHAIAHSKVMIIDTETVITGSFNFTKAAEERNAENLLIIRSSDLAHRYLNNWHFHRAHSIPLH